MSSVWGEHKNTKACLAWLGWDFHPPRNVVQTFREAPVK
jgi:hypothetical protein